MALDAFPYDVGTPDGRLWRTARIVEHDGRVHVFVSEDGKPVKVAEAELVGPVPDGRRVVRSLETIHGSWTVDRSAGCGCRDVLKRTTKVMLMDLIEPSAEHVTTRAAQ